MRICSLLPSATEILFALGCGDLLVAVTHECDYPAGACRLPKVTRSNIPAGISSDQIDSAVTSSLQTSGSLYELDLPLLEHLQPDLIITQRLCDVCAVSSDRVEQAVSDLKSQPEVLNLEPHSLEDILRSIRTVADEIGRPHAADHLIESLQRRIEAVWQTSSDLTNRPRVFCMEWVSPPFCGGHWMKELVEIAGGVDDLSNLHQPSRRIEWTEVLRFAPEVIVLTCCGFNLGRCVEEGLSLSRLDHFFEMPAAKSGRVFATDGSAYFSRPGPRIVDSLEILAYLIHPEVFRAPPLSEAFCVLHPSPAEKIGPN
jgi:iron complex transport system substrate-binding protein